MAQEKQATNHLEKIDAAGDTSVADVMGRPVVVTHQRGAKSGEPRRVPLMRVEHDGSYAAVASKGGAPKNPVWYQNLVVHPEIEVMDGTQTHPVTARLLEPGSEEYREWWGRAVENYPPYAEYRTNTDRVIPIFVLEPR